MNRVKDCSYFSIAEAEIQIRTNATCSGACPVPNCTVSWTSVAPARLNITSLVYTVFCCGERHKSYCYSPQKYKEELKALRCCRKSFNQSGVALSCDVTGAMRDIYKRRNFPRPELVLYTVIALTDRDNNTRSHFSQPSAFNRHTGKSKLVMGSICNS